MSFLTDKKNHKSKKIVYFALDFAEDDEKTLVPDTHVSAFGL